MLHFSHPVLALSERIYSILGLSNNAISLNRLRELRCGKGGQETKTGGNVGPGAETLWSQAEEIARRSDFFPPPLSGEGPPTATEIST